MLDIMKIQLHIEHTNGFKLYIRPGSLAGTCHVLLFEFVADQPCKYGTKSCSD